MSLWVVVNIQLFATGVISTYSQKNQTFKTLRFQSGLIGDNQAHLDFITLRAALLTFRSQSVKRRQIL